MQATSGAAFNQALSGRLRRQAVSPPGAYIMNLYPQSRAAQPGLYYGIN